MTQENEPGAARAGIGAFLAAAFLTMAPAMAVAGGLALAPIQGLAGAFGAPWRRLLRHDGASWALIILLLAFTAWTAASAFWSPNPSTLQGAKLAGGMVCGILFVLACGLDAPARRVVRATGVACIAMLILLLAVEALGDMPLNRMAQPDAETGVLMRNPARGASFLIIALWGAMGALVGGNTIEQAVWKLIFLTSGLLAFQFSMDANALAFVLGTGAFVLGYVAFRFALWALIAGIGGWLIAAPWAIPALLATPLAERLPDSWIVRSAIWRFVSTRIAESPVLGAGLDASRHFKETARAGELAFPTIPLHPHSGSLQVWFETGGVGAMLALAVLIAGGLAAQRAFAERPAAGAALCGAIAASGVIANVSYGLWQEWWIATMMTGVALASAARR